jgi:hypothetical protein
MENFMPSIIDHETMNVDELPGIWSPVQWELTEEERIQELDTQARASLVSVIDAPEAVLRLLLDETAIERAFDPPSGYNPEQQGEWDPDLLTFQFQRPITLVKVERGRERLYIEYRVADLGYWALVIEPEHVEIYRI